MFYSEIEKNENKDAEKMGLSGYITLGISISGFIGGIIMTVAKLSIRFGKIEERLTADELRDKEERDKASVKFSELYNRVATNESDVKELNAKVDSLNVTCVRIENKLDKLIERL